MNFCKRCILRSFGVRDREAYISKELDGFILDQTEIIHKPTCYCPGCLGLLETTQFQTLGDQIKEMLLKAGHRGLTDFFMSIRVPTSLLIRQRAMILIL